MAGYYDPTQTALNLATLLARADGRQFTLTLKSPSSPILRGTHPQQEKFHPTKGNTTQLVYGTWSAVYRGVQLQGEPLVADLPRAQEHEGAVLGRALEVFDLVDLRLGTQGGNVNDLAPNYQPYQVIRVDSVTATGGSGSNAGIVVKGAGFARAVQVIIGGVAVIPTVLHDGTLTASAPGSAFNGPVSVVVTSVYGAQYNGALAGTFSYPPQIFSISPTSGPITGGTSVTIYGVGLASPTVLTIGGEPPTVTSNNGGAIVATTAPGDSVGSADVFIQTASGSFTLPGAFAYTMPTPIKSFDFSSMPLGGAAIAGLSFQRASLATCHLSLDVMQVGIANDTPRISYKGLMITAQYTNACWPSVPPATDTGTWNGMAGGGGFSYNPNLQPAPDGTTTGAQSILSSGSNSWNWMYPSAPTTSSFSFYVQQKGAGKNLFVQIPNQALTVVLGTSREGNFLPSTWRRVSTYQATSTFLSFHADEVNPPPYDFKNGCGFDHWGHQCETGKIVHPYFPTTTGPGTCAAEKPSIPSASALLNNGTLTVNIEDFSPLGAMSGDGGDYPGTIRLWTDENDTTTYCEITNGKLSISVAGSVWTSGVTIHWNNGNTDCARILTVAGNGKSSALIQVNDGPLVNLGQSSGSYPALTLAGSLAIGHDGSGNKVIDTDGIRKLEFYKAGQLPLWAAFPVTRTAATREVSCAGDSITQGYNLTDPSTQSWAGQMQIALGRTYLVDNLGISGYQLNQLVTEISRVTTNDGMWQRRTIVVFLGTNDLASGSTPSVVFANLQTVVNAILAKGDNVILPTVLPRTTGEANRQTYNALIRAMYGGGAVPGVFVADCGNDATIGQAGQNTNPVYYQSDFTHPTFAGDTIIEGYIAAQVLLAA